MDPAALCSQRQDIFNLMESLNFLNLKHHFKFLKDLLNNILCSKFDRNSEDEGMDPKFIKPIVQHYKTALTKFNDASFVFTCSTYD
jgi:hypothetical protein